jgi:subtilase family serine protease
VLRSLARAGLALSLSFIVMASSYAQASTPSSRAAAKKTEMPLVRLSGTVHPLARPENDRGAVPDSFPASRMLVLLNPPADRQQALQRFLRDAHASGSPTYHQWLTPEQFGAQFGARDEDVQQVQSWLQSHGFAVNRLSKGRRALEFSGTAAQVREALHAPIHQYEVAGKTYYSIASEISVPQSIAPLLKGFAPLNNFPLRSDLHSAGKATYRSASGSTNESSATSSRTSAGTSLLTAQGGRARPQFTTAINGQPFYAIAPEDFATQYNIGPQYQAGTNGAGQTIGVIGEFNLDLTVTAAYRMLFGLSSDNTQVVIDGQDPGTNGAPGSAGAVGFTLLSSIGTTYVSVEPEIADNYLSVEIAGAVAPKATVNYYLAGGSDFQNAIVLAALRAVEDNQASVLSVAYHNCEQLLGPSGNQFWSSLWEQAAAQGQTVLVSSGDEGPAACGAEISVDGQITYLGPSISGLASTPWNVAVGASDFYYSDYATGAPSAAGDWNASNDANFGSLKTPLPEQPWDEELGLNVPLFFGDSVGIIGIINPLAFGESTGGGASNCSQLTPSLGPGGLPYTCVSGYSKPSWQNAPGVPADGARDIPDISVLAADGANLSAYAVCVEVNDCAAVSSGQPQVTLAGGPAASTAAMAGIMALINQKYGRQGQANFVLYALAQQQPSVFHDVTVGTNDVVCVMSAPNCTTQVPNTTGEYSFGVYNAGVGYDLASGLGSVDVNALVNDWNKVTFSASNTTLQLSPASIEHGAAVTVTASVKAASGTATPTGDVSIETTSPTPILKSDVLTLAAGTATGSLNFFPGGTYSVTAQYAGDGTFATSTSAPSMLTVTPEPSTTSLTLQYESQGAALPIATSGTVPNGGSAPFGSRWNFIAQPTGQTSQSSGDATGSATFTDGATSVTVPLNAQGIANWSPQTLALGAHSVTVSYTGDASYNSSTGGPLAFTVNKGALLLEPSVEAPTASITLGSPLVVTYQAGSTALMHVALVAENSSVPPTGNVTVTFGTMTQMAAVTSEMLSSGTNSGVSVAFANVAAGTYTLSASYSGDSNWNANTSAPQSYTFVASSATPTTTTLSLTPANVDSSGVVTFTATVTASQAQNFLGIFGGVTLFANGFAFASVNVQTSLTNPGSLTATGTAVIPATQIPAGALQVTATFQGGSTLMSSSSAPVPLTVTLSDFTLSSGVRSVTVKSGQSTSIPLLLGGPNGGSATVSLNCLPSMLNFQCIANSATQTVKGATTASVMINAYINTTGTTAGINAISRSLLTASASFAFAFALLFLLPNRKELRKHYGGLQLCCALLAVGTLIAGCGGGSGSVAPPPPQTISTPPGTYNVVITGTSGAIAHNTSVIVTVQ